MNYRKLGRTGIDVSEFIFGCGAVGGIMIRSDDETMRRVIRIALDAGINWFDTASSYGQGKSEENLGRMLSEIDETPHVSTKIRLDMAADPLDIAGQIERQMTESLSRLQLDRIELYQLHNNIGGTRGDRQLGLEDVLGTGGVLDTLERLRDQGLTRFIGITALGDLDLVKQVIASGRIDTAQVYVNLINPSAGRAATNLSSGQNLSGLVDCCAENDVGVIAIRTLAAGVLATDERHGRESILTPNTELSAEERICGEVFGILGDEYGTRAQTALRYVLSNPKVSCIDFAAGEIAHLEEALPAIALGPLPKAAMDALDLYYLG